LPAAAFAASTTAVTAVACAALPPVRLAHASVWVWGRNRVSGAVTFVYPTKNTTTVMIPY
jgi:hypothetical protein